MPSKIGDNSLVEWQTKRVGADRDVLAPDGSEIRRLVQVRGGSLVFCTVPPGQVTRAVQHRSVEEVWYCVSGAGELWRRDPANATEEIVALEAGTAATIPLGTAFQFRAADARPL
ncbi:MAG: cupin domain-containing protein, partial [Chloroflexi bacterium]|nr:cupin domain-containing protein [Chloroflexota bacterium]